MRSRSEAADLIAAGRVSVNRAASFSRAHLVSTEDVLEVAPGPRFVGRGGYKLWAALSDFGISVMGKECLDVGASTGGFVDCLLQRGAKRVVAVDVGHGQLAADIRNDSRVMAREGTDVRTLTPADVGGPFSLVTVDVSFISVTQLTAAIAEMTASSGDALVLVKAQFEVGRESAGRGVVRSDEAREAALQRVVSALEEVGFDSLTSMESPVLGEAGNRESFLWGKKA